jgi:hypothetical protein
MPASSGEWVDHALVDRRVDVEVYERVPAVGTTGPFGARFGKGSVAMPVSR